MAGLLKELWEILWSFLRCDFRITWAVASGAARRLFASFAVEAVGVLIFAALAQFHPYWYMMCAAVAAVVSLYQYSYLAAITVPAAVNFALSHQLALMLAKILDSSRVPFAKIAEAVAQFREKIDEIIKQPKGEIGDSIMSLLLQVVRPLELPNAVVSTAVDPMIAVIKAADKTIQELPKSTLEQVIKVAGPAFSTLLVFQWFSVAGWALLAFSPRAITLAPVFVAAVGATLTLLAYPHRTKEHTRTKLERGALWVLGISLACAAFKYYDGSLFLLPLFVVAFAAALAYALLHWGVRFGGSALVLAIGIWGIVMPQHWITTWSHIGSADNRAHEEVVVNTPDAQYQEDWKGLYTPDTAAAPLKVGDQLRLVTGSSLETPTIDGEGNSWIHVIGVYNAKTKMVPQGSKRFWYPAGYVRKKQNKPGDQNAILHPGTGDTLAIFNPADALRNVEAVHKLAHPLAGRGSPVLGYGSEIPSIPAGRPERVNKSVVFVALPGTAVSAAEDGIVAEVEYAKDGSTVSILHALPDGQRLCTRYHGMAFAAVAFGDTVARGSAIGESSSRLRFEVAEQTPGTAHYAYANPMLRIEGIPVVRIPIGEGPDNPAPYAMVASPLPGSRDLYPFCVSQAVTVLDRLGEAGDEVEITLLSPSDANYYVADGKNREHPFRSKLLSPTGWNYPEGWQQKYVFCLSPRVATYAMLITGVNGFSEPLGYGRTLQLTESGWICIGINEIVQYRRPDGSLYLMDDRALNNYREGPDQFILVKATFRRNGVII